jgi:hypothetical protein
MRVRNALANVSLMSGIRLTDAEITAVVQHLEFLNR